MNKHWIYTKGKNELDIYSTFIQTLSVGYSNASVNDFSSPTLAFPGFSTLS